MQSRGNKYCLVRRGWTKKPVPTIGGGEVSCRPWFWCTIDRKPEIYNFSFWDYFTNVYI